MASPGAPKPNMLQELKIHWVAGACAGMVESVVTMPFEVMKTRLQMSGGGSWRVALCPSSNGTAGDSMRKAFAGLSPLLVQTSMKIGIRFAAFEALKPLSSSALIAGFGAGAFEALVWITPTERLKTLRITSGAEHRTMVSSVKLLINSQGIQGLWRGGTATVARNSSSVGIRFWLVEKITIALQRFSPSSASMHSGIAGFLAGGITTVFNQPLDVIKTLMSADQVAGGKPKFSSNVECIKHVWNVHGIRGFTTGLAARIMKVSIGQGVIFTIYERVSKLLQQ